MAIVPRTLDYTDKDFDSLRDRLILLIRSVFPDWTDYNVLNFGNLLMELFAFVGDVLCFYQDNQAQESRWSTATQRASIIKLAKLIGYELSGQSAATTDIVLTLGSPPIGNVSFPAGTMVRTLDITNPIRFQTLAAVAIPAGTDPPTATVGVEHSLNRSELFNASLQPDQAVLLNYTPYLDLSAVVNTLQGAWTEVDNFLESGPTDKHYTVEVDQNDRATIRFGDGNQGLIPQGTITVGYKTGGGAEGNVEQNQIKIVEEKFQDHLGNPVTVTCNNALKATGGAPRMSVETARQEAPVSIRAPRTTVAREDYEIHANAVPGVARSLMLTSDQYPIIAENTGNLYLIPEGGGLPSTLLKEAVLIAVTVTYPNTITFKCFVSDPQYKTINIQAAVFLRQGSAPATVKAAILANLAAWFAISNDDGTPNQNVDFGYNYKDADGNPAGEVAFSDVYNVVHDTTGVRKIGDKFEDFLLNGADRDVELDLREFPKLGTVTLINGDTGLPL